MKPFDLIRTTNTLPTNKQLRQTKPFPLKHTLQLLSITRIHRYIPFIHKHPKPFHNQPNFATIFVRFPNPSQTRVIQHDSIFTTR
ncbi:hypothetical protein HanPSC8_Chr01g0011671 [Helianthus annuus]|nr:hypothetical protein HanPSC8_Chr01g0011671 [Helianthus annuus]